MKTVKDRKKILQQRGGKKLIAVQRFGGQQPHAGNDSGFHSVPCHMTDSIVIHGCRECTDTVGKLFNFKIIYTSFFGNFFTTCSYFSPC